MRAAELNALSASAVCSGSITAPSGSQLTSRSRFIQTVGAFFGHYGNPNTNLLSRRRFTRSQPTLTPATSAGALLGPLDERGDRSARTLLNHAVDQKSDNRAAPAQASSASFFLLVRRSTASCSGRHRIRAPPGRSVSVVGYHSPAFRVSSHGAGTPTESGAFPAPWRSYIAQFQSPRFRGGTVR